MAVLAPMPSASVRIAVAANAGFLRSMRTASVRPAVRVSRNGKPPLIAIRLFDAARRRRSARRAERRRVVLVTRRAGSLRLPAGTDASRSLRELRFLPARPKQRAQPRPEHAQRRHTSSSSSRLTIDTVRAQFFSSSASCFFPARVMA